VTCHPSTLTLSTRVEQWFDGSKPACADRVCEFARRPHTVPRPESNWRHMALRSITPRLIRQLDPPQLVSTQVIDPDSSS
jgi:hypothetical protein